MNTLLPLVRHIVHTAKPLRIMQCGVQDYAYTKALLTYCDEHSAQLHSADSAPGFSVAPLQTQHPEWTHQNTLGVNALANTQRCDIVILHEDANWFTVYQSLIAIEQHWCQGNIFRFPLVIVHGTKTHGYKDHYRDPARIPDAYRQAHDNHTALYEQNPRNGVRRAIEDFCSTYNASGTLRTAFFDAHDGIGILASTTAIPTIATVMSCIENTEMMAPFIDMIESTTQHTANDQHYKTVVDALVKEHKERTEESSATIAKLEYDLAEMKHALKASNESRMHQVQLLAKELELVQRLLADEQKTTKRPSIQSIPVQHTQKAHSFMYKIFGALKDLWVDFGQPFPRLTRAVRYGIFKAFPPKE